MKQTNNGTRKRFPLSFRTVVWILSLLIVVNVAFLFYGLRDSFSVSSYPYSYDEMIWAAERRDYLFLSDMVAENKLSPRTYDDTTKEFEAFCDYYEAAYWSRAYRLDGDSEKAAEYLALAEEYDAAITLPELRSFAEELKAEMLP